MEYKNIVLKYYWDQPFVQVLTFLRNKQLLSVVTCESVESEVFFCVCVGATFLLFQCEHFVCTGSCLQWN